MKDINLPQDKILILFDGVCNLCNSSVLFVIKRDSKNTFMFAPLQGVIGTTLIDKFNIDTQKMDSILTYHPKEDKIKYKSNAALEISKHLRFPYSLAQVFLVIPTVIRNWFYDFVARNRYEWFGKKEACMIPTPELKSKFLE